jgi:hypothetical protein
MDSGLDRKAGGDKPPKSERLNRRRHARGELRSLEPRAGDKLAKVGTGPRGAVVGG